MRITGAHLGDQFDADWISQKGLWHCSGCGGDGTKPIEMRQGDKLIEGAYLGVQTVTDPDPQWDEYRGRAWCSNCGTELQRAVTQEPA